MRSLRWFTALLAALALAGCGTKFATMQGKFGEDLMLLGHDPVAYFTVGKPTRGNPDIRAEHDGVTFYFASQQNRSLFQASPDKYFPQYGAFCASGATYGLKLGSDPTEFEIVNGRIYFFGDVLGKEAWSIDPDWQIRHGDQMWPESRETGWRWQSLKRYASKVPWYRNTADVHKLWAAKHPDKPMSSYDPGGMVTNLFLQSPGWRARTGFGPQPVVGLVGVDPCPPACPGEVSKKFGEK